MLVKNTRSLARRVTFYFFIVLIILFLVLINIFAPSAVSLFRVRVKLIFNAIIPVSSDIGHDIKSYFNDFNFNASSRISELKRENILLKIKASDLESEVINLRKISALQSDLRQDVKFVASAHLIRLDLLDNYSCLVKVSRHVNKGDLMVIGRTLIGRVSLYDSASSVAEVELITNYTFRVPVLVGKNLFYAIVSGTSEFDGCQLELHHYHDNAVTNPLVGDIVVTAGEFGLIRSDLVIGRVSKVENGTICVKQDIDIRDSGYNFSIISNS